MTDFIKVVILALVQGFTEFLPVSSSGHLSILGHFLGIREDSLLLSVCLHSGTLVSVFIFYFQELREFFSSRILLYYLLISSLPAGILGCFLKFTGLGSIIFEKPIFAGIGLILTSIILSFLPSKPEEIPAGKISKLNFRHALFIGLAQMLAIFPGVSRSGTTICAGIKRGLGVDFSTKYSFFMFIPVVLGSLIIEIYTATENEFKFNENIFRLFIGFLLSAVVGFFVIKILINILKRGKIIFFRYYCLGLGSFILLYQLYGLLK